MSSVQKNVEPIRPGGGLRRLRQGDISTRSSSPSCSYPQLIAKLNADIEVAKVEDESLLLVKLAYKPLPGTTQDAARAHQLPQEVLDRLVGVHDDIKIAVLSPSEAVVLLSGMKRRADGDELATALRNALVKPIQLNGIPHHLSPMVGAAVLDQENGDVEQLLEASRLAFAEADPAKSPVSMFHPYQRTRLKRRTKREDLLHDAVRSHQITCDLQPAYDFETGRLVAFEAFARLRPEGGAQIPPLEFIPMSAELGVLHYLSRQVMARGLGAVGAWERRSDAPPLTLWINFRDDEVRHPDFAEAIRAAIDLDPRITIGLELSPVPSEVDGRDIFPVLTDLVAHGARVAVGDFGIGAANLPLMEQLPFDSVKLQGTLIRQMTNNPRAKGVVESLIHLANTLELECTAQNVETEEQMRVLKQLGCNIGQGIFFGAQTDDVSDVPPVFTFPQ
ncbi:MAG: EAL domain-containing protein [Actinomycetota bacterium]